MKILIAGFGYLGTALARELVAAGHDVIGLRRSAPTERSAEGWLALQADLLDAASLSKLPSDIDQVVYAVSPDKRDDASYEEAYVRGLRLLLERCAQARFLFVSSTAVYGQTDGVELNEDSIAAATHFSALRLREAEELLLKRKAAHVVVRASGIYGPGRTRLVSRLRDTELSDGERDICTSRIHRDDLARVMHFLIDRRKLRGIFIASDQEPATLCEMQDWIRKSPHSKSLPQLESCSPTRARKNRRLVPKRLKEEGFHFRYPSFREGYDAILRGPSDND